MLLWYSLEDYVLFLVCDEAVKVVFLLCLVLVFCVVKFLVNE